MKILLMFVMSLFIYTDSFSKSYDSLRNELKKYICEIEASDTILFSDTVWSQIEPNNDSIIIAYYFDFPSWQRYWHIWNNKFNFNIEYNPQCICFKYPDSSAISIQLIQLIEKEDWQAIKRFKTEMGTSNDGPSDIQVIKLYFKNNVIIKKFFIVPQLDFFFEEKERFGN